MNKGIKAVLYFTDEFMDNNKDADMEREFEIFKRWKKDIEDLELIPKM